jgi:hypothetical protein
MGGKMVTPVRHRARASVIASALLLGLALTGCLGARPSALQERADASDENRGVAGSAAAGGDDGEAGSTEDPDGRAPPQGADTGVGGEDADGDGPAAGGAGGSNDGVDSRDDLVEGAAGAGGAGNAGAGGGAGHGTAGLGGGIAGTGADGGVDVATGAAGSSGSGGHGGGGSGGGGTGGTGGAGCPAAPADCLQSGVFVAGAVCAPGGAGVSACSLDAVNHCPVISAAAPCPSPQTCHGTLPTAACACTAVAACGGTGNGAHCADTTTLVTCAAAGTCQQAATATCTAVAAEHCIGAFPTAECEKAFGHTSTQGGTTSLSTALLFGEPITVTTAITVTRVGLVAASASMRARFAIYADDSGQPGAWLASAIQPTQTVAAGRNEFAINDTPGSRAVVLAAGTYWIFVVLEADTSLIQGSPASSVRYASWSPWNSPFPTTSPMATTPDTLPPLELYVVGAP